MKPIYTSVDLDRGNLYYRGIDKDGNRVRTEYPYKPSVFYPTDEITDFKSLDGRYLKRRQFDTVGKAYGELKEYRDVSGAEIFGQTNFINQFIQDHFPEEPVPDISKISIATIDIETECEEGFPDIEKAQQEIICLTVYESITKTYYVFSLKERGRVQKEMLEEYKKPDENIKCLEYGLESEMLAAFLRLWSKPDQLDFPDVLTGWHSRFFDVPYLVHRLYNIFDHEYVDQHLSPWGLVKRREIAGNYGNTRIVYELGGIKELDYMELYQKFNLTRQESYALNHIAYVELNEQKLSYEEYDSMHLFYLEDYPKFVAYNVKDVWLINRLEDKLKLLEFAITLAYMARVNYSDVYFPVRLIESLCYRDLLDKNIIMKAKSRDANSKAAYVGAFVKEPYLGAHDWVVSFDLNSLYPSIIRQLNLSPETLRPEHENMSVSIDSLLNKRVDLSYLRPHNLTVAANGHHFDRTTLGFLPEIITNLVDGRKTVKKEMLEAQQKLQTAKGEEKNKLEYEIAFKDLKQLALKVLANSIYGAMGNQYFAFYDTRLASAITKHGQYVIRLIEGEMNRFMNHLNKTEDEDYVIYMDTDSIYISFDKVIQKYKERTGETDTTKIVDYLDRLCQERVEVWIDKVYNKMAEETNAYEPHMVMKREVIASRGIWVAKKKYCLYVYDSEGVRFAQPKLKIMGIETQRSSTPEWCRDNLKESIKIILTQNEQTLQKFVAQKREEHKGLSVSDIAFPRSLNDYNKWIGQSNAGDFTLKGTPINVRAAFVHNKIVREKGLEKHYRDLSAGNKIKFIYLREPNPTMGNVVAFANSLPEEFGLNSFIDYSVMYEKSFLNPLQKILDVIGWKAVKVHTLEDVFGVSLI